MAFSVYVSIFSCVIKKDMPCGKNYNILLQCTFGCLTLIHLTHLTFQLPTISNELNYSSNWFLHCFHPFKMFSNLSSFICRHNLARRITFNIVAWKAYKILGGSLDERMSLFLNSQLISYIFTNCFVLHRKERHDDMLLQLAVSRPV